MSHCIYINLLKEYNALVAWLFNEAHVLYIIFLRCKPCHVFTVYTAWQQYIWFNKGLAHFDSIALRVCSAS